MSINVKAPRELLRTGVLRAAPGRVDRKQKVIYGAKLMQLGDVNDSRPWTVDEETLNQVLEFASQPNKGLKARWTHPNLSGDGLGKYLGRWQNPRIEEDAVVADLHLADVAFDTPKGDLGTYVMDLAEEDPEAFGISLATKLDDVMFTEDYEGPLRLAGLRAGDFVDEPAATRGGLFELDNQADLDSVATWILDHHFADAEPSVVVNRLEGFLSRYFGESVSMTKNQNDKGEGSNTPETTPAPQPADFRVEAKPFIEKFGQQGSTWFLEGKTLLECYETHTADLSKQLAAANEQVEQLKKDLADVKLGEEEGLSADDDSELSNKPKSLADLVNIK